MNFNKVYYNNKPAVDIINPVMYNNKIGYLHTTIYVEDGELKVFSNLGKATPELDYYTKVNTYPFNSKKGRTLFEPLLDSEDVLETLYDKVNKEVDTFNGENLY